MTLQQRPTDHLQRLLSGKLTNVFPITWKITFDYLGPFFSCERNVDEAHRFLLGAATGAGDPSDSDSVARHATLADTFGHRRRHFAANRSMLIDERLRNVRELRFQFIGVDDGPA